MTGGIHHVDGDALGTPAIHGCRAGILDRRVLCQDSDAFFALQVARIHDPFRAVRPESLGVSLFQHGVDQGRFPVINVRDDGDISDILTLCHKPFSVVTGFPKTTSYCNAAYSPVNNGILAPGIASIKSLV